jgi:DtxR family manganese transport transcriptional regulator
MRSGDAFTTRVARPKIRQYFLRDDGRSEMTFEQNKTASLSDPESHERIRQDHSSEKAEDYVEAVAEILQSKDECRVADLATLFGVSHVTVTRIVQRLVGEGLMKTEPYRPIRLTAKGKRLAVASRKRHATVHAFLLAIGVDEATAIRDAEGIEHHVSPATLVKLAELTNRLNGSPELGSS